MFDLDDYNADKWFVLYDKYIDFFDSLDEQMGGKVLEELPEPSPAELVIMNANAEQLLNDVLGV